MSAGAIPADVLASRKRKFEQRSPDVCSTTGDAELAAKLQTEENTKSHSTFSMAVPDGVGPELTVLAPNGQEMAVFAVVPDTDFLMEELYAIPWESLAAQEDVRRIQTEGSGQIYKVGEVVPISDNLRVIDQNYWNNPSNCGAAKNAAVFGAKTKKKERDAHFPELWTRPASRPWDPENPCVDCTMQECQEILEKKYNYVQGALGDPMFLCKNPGNNNLLRFLVSWFKHVTSTFFYQLDDKRKVLRKQVICTSLQTFLGTNYQGIMRAVMEHETFISSPDDLIQLKKDRKIRALGSLPLFAITMRMGWERTAALKQYFIKNPLRGGWAMIPLEGEIPASQMRALLSRAHLP